MIFLCSTISSSKSIFVMVMITSALIAPAGHLHRFLDASGLAGCSFLLYCVSHRTSPCLGRSPLVCFACGWLCSSACCWHCSSACCWLCSSRFFSSYSRCPRTRVANSFLSPQDRWLWFCLGFSPLALWLWFRLILSFSESICGKLRLRTPLPSIAPFVVDGSRKVPSIHGKVVYNNVV